MLNLKKSTTSTSLEQTSDTTGIYSTSGTTTAPTATTTRLETYLSSISYQTDPPKTYSPTTHPATMNLLPNLDPTSKENLEASEPSASTHDESGKIINNNNIYFNPSFSNANENFYSNGNDETVELHEKDKKLSKEIFKRKNQVFRYFIFLSLNIFALHTT